MFKNLFSPPTVTFCEEITNNFISRPNYAISNLAYIVIAVILFGKIKQNKIFLPFAILALAVGTASMIYDIRPLYITQLVDLLMMLLIAGLMISLNLSRLYKFTIQKSVAITVALVAVGMSFILIFQGNLGTIVFGILVALLIILELLIYKNRLHKHYKYFITAFAIFLIAFLFWLPDGTHKFCNNIELLNGRAIFHYLTAISVYMLAIFYSKNK